MKRHLGEAGILPDGELILAEAVAGDELPVLRVPHDGGDLATRVHTLQLVHAARVPHPVHTHMVTMLYAACVVQLELAPALVISCSGFSTGAREAVPDGRKFGRFTL